MTLRMAGTETEEAVASESCISLDCRNCSVDCRKAAKGFTMDPGDDHQYTPPHKASAQQSTRSLQGRERIAVGSCLLATPEAQENSSLRWTVRGRHCTSRPAPQHRRACGATCRRCDSASPQGEPVPSPTICSSASSVGGAVSGCWHRGGAARGGGGARGRTRGGGQEDEIEEEKDGRQMRTMLYGSTNRRVDKRTGDTMDTEGAPIRRGATQQGDTSGEDHGATKDAGLNKEAVAPPGGH